MTTQTKLTVRDLLLVAELLSQPNLQTDILIGNRIRDPSLVTCSSFLRLGSCPCHAGRAQRFLRGGHRLPFVEDTDLQQTEVLSRSTLDTEPENAFP